MRLSRIIFLCAGFAAALPIAGSSTACSRATGEVFIPLQRSAAEQYAYAIYYRNKHEFALRNLKRMDNLESTRYAVRQAFDKVVKEFPEDREVTPLAKLELIELSASLDDQRLTPTKRASRAAIPDLDKLREEYPEFEFIQAKTVYDQALCRKNLEEYDRAQELFRRVMDEYGKNENRQIRALAERAAYFYQRTYIKEDKG